MSRSRAENGFFPRRASLALFLPLRQAVEGNLQACHRFAAPRQIVDVNIAADVRLGFLLGQDAF